MGTGMLENMNKKKSTYLYHACFERVRSASGRSGAESQPSRSSNKVILLFSVSDRILRDFASLRRTEFLVPDLALIDRARILKFQNGRHKTQNTREGIPILNGCEGSQNGKNRSTLAFVLDNSYL